MDMLKNSHVIDLQVATCVSTIVYISFSGPY